MIRMEVISLSLSHIRYSYHCRSITLMISLHVTSFSTSSPKLLTPFLSLTSSSSCSPSHFISSSECNCTLSNSFRVRLDKVHVSSSSGIIHPSFLFSLLPSFLASSPSSLSHPSYPHLIHSSFPHSFAFSYHPFPLRSLQSISSSLLL